MVQTNGTKAEIGAGSQTRASGPLAGGAGAGALFDALGEGEEGGGGHPSARPTPIPWDPAPSPGTLPLH